MDRSIEVTVNGQKHSVKVEPGQVLLSLIRNTLSLTGAKYGCGEAQCGACTVLVNDRAVRSCVTPAESVQGKQILTIEGLAENGKLHPVQRAFLEESAFQCGYCTPGMIMSLVALLRSNPNPSDEEVRKGLAGNMCRCCAYTRIWRAVRKVAGHRGASQ